MYSLHDIPTPYELKTIARTAKASLFYDDFVENLSDMLKKCVLVGADTCNFNIAVSYEKWKNTQYNITSVAPPKELQQHELKYYRTFVVSHEFEIDEDLLHYVVTNISEQLELLSYDFKVCSFTIYDKTVLYSYSIDLSHINKIDTT